MKDQINMYASTDARKFAIFEGESNHCILFEYLPSEKEIEVSIRTGENIEGTYKIQVDSNVMGRKHDEVISLIHYLERVLNMQ